LKRLLRLLILPAILIPLALSSLSCGDDDDGNPMNPPPGGTADVTITIQGGMNGTYSPNPANLTVGQTVRWKNNDSMTHSATHASAFNPVIPAGGSSPIFTMSNAGTFGYVCNQPGHNMSGSIIVAP
jgi:plastocyanin